jgi:hypothetical protein
MPQAPTPELIQNATELIRQADDPSVALDVGLYECAMLSEMTRLNEARADLIADIQKSGTIYG